MALPIRIISSMATKQLLSDLIAQYQQEFPHREVEVESVGGVDAAKRVQAGESFDIVALASNAIEQLTAAGKIVPATRVDLVRSGVAAAVRSGSARPDISSEDAVKHAVVSARTLGYSTGPSGVQLAKLFERWGIADQIRGRIVTAPPGVPVGALIAKGEVELGFQQLSELINLSGIDLLGPLPPTIQITTVFSAGVSVTSNQSEAAQALLNFMASPATAQTKLRNGMEAATAHA
jgi:molybdate transport system substrate-binding protein